MIEIAGCGYALPQREVTNAELEGSMMTSAAFIRERTGVLARRYVSEPESNASLLMEAAEKALADARLSASAVDMLIVSTLSPDYHDPSQACLVHGLIPGMREIPIFDIRAQCSGFLYGLLIARSVLLTHDADVVLLACSEVLSRRVWGDLGDRNIAVLVGDGAGVVVVRRRDGEYEAGLLDIRLGGDGSHHSDLRTVGPGVATGKFVASNPAVRDFQFRMDGASLRVHAVETMRRAIQEILERNRLTMTDVDAIICHQPNPNMVVELAERFEGHREKFHVNGNRYGNVASASLAISWAEHSREARPGSLSLIVGYGAGATWGAALYRHPSNGS